MDDVIPWWMRHGIAPKGAVQSCIRDDGTILSTDLWSWSQWRAVWVFSKLYNAFGQKQEWLDIARGIYDFQFAHGPMPNGHWALVLAEDGSVKRGFESGGTDMFAINGMAELYRATGDEEVRRRALATYEAIEAFRRDPGPPETRPQFPYPAPEGIVQHGSAMSTSLIYWELGQVLGASAIRDQAVAAHRTVMDVFLRRDRGIVLERLNADGTEAPPPLGSVVVPGHAIESMWFQIHLARDRNDRATIDRAIRAIPPHLDLGWDKEYGGILLAVDISGRKEVDWKWHDTKLWWPQCEALYATMLAYEYCREDWCMEWHARIREYCLSHYPVKDHGEWTQKLDRQGNVLNEVIALPVKDPFHLPRVLIYLVESLGRLRSG